MPPGSDNRPVLRDVFAGVSVALVLVPQALAYAVLAGMPAHRGIYASILPLIAAAAFASSPFLQTGPTALSALLTYTALVALAPPGSTEYIGLGILLALMVGVIKLLLGLSRAGNLAYLLSEPALLGFTSAAGVLILAAQVPDVLGFARSDGGVLGAAVEAVTHPAQWRLASVALAGLTVALVLGSRRLHPLVPGTLLATALGIAFTLVVGYDGPRVGAVPARVGEFSLALPWGVAPALLAPAAVIAVVGFAESAAISRTLAARHHTRWDPHRELVGQGVANLAAALAGAFPISGSFSRSVLNWLAGARTRWSSGFTGLAVLAFLPLAPLLADLPRTILAGIVMAAISGLIRIRPLVELWGLSRPQCLVAWTTFALTLLLAPHVDRALLLGVILAAGVHLWRELPVEVAAWSDDDTLHLRPSGVLWFGSAPRLEQTFLDLLAQHVRARRLVIHLDGLGRVDLSGAMLLRTLVEDSREAGLEVELQGAHPQTARSLHRVLGEHSDARAGPP